VYDQGTSELKALGYSIKQSSWYGETMVVVCACHSMTLPYAEYVATRNQHNTWEISRTY
jgi:hypothetical protein